METRAATIRAMNRRVTSAVKSLIYSAGLVGLARRMGAQGSSMPLIRYHSVSRSPDYCPRSISVSPELFDREIAYLAAHYNVIRHEEVVACLEEGRAFPERAVSISFDDGYRDNVMAALPILNRHGVSAMFYVAAGPVVERQRFWVGWLQRAVFATPEPQAMARAFDIPLAAIHRAGAIDRQSLVDIISRLINSGSLSVREDVLRRVEGCLAPDTAIPDGVDFMMDVDDLRALAEAGMGIGSHTITHAVLTGLPEDEALHELAASRAMLEAALGQPVQHLAYPNGPGDTNFDAITMRLAAQAGYRSAVTSVRGAATLDAELRALPRQGINYKLDFAAFAFKVEEHRFSALLNT
jgi:peptidoglycan/xylan/chitin deacetylase (PgdA/CDA1 family)